MIGYLKGKVIDRGLNRLVVETGGVGYVIHVVETPMAETQSLNEAEYWIHTHVREEEISLYGFTDKKQLGLFELLLTVSGVGPKVAMAILRGAKTERIQEAIARADVGFFTSIKGLGKKGAQKIIIELKNKVGSVMELDLSDEGGDEVVAGLVAMGFDTAKVKKVLRELDAGMSEEKKLKEAIRRLSKRN